MSKLTNDRAWNLMDDLAQGMTNDEAAGKYKLHSRYVSLIRHGRRWRKLRAEWERATTSQKA
ncbi:hypothetical protein [Paenibacillus larvae]